jgi:uncharacterized protein YbaR (Trm112 family)
MQQNLPWEFLVCLQDHTQLKLADDALVQQINRAIAAGQLTSAAGRGLDKPIDGGLLREDGRMLYPIVDEIPILLAGEAIAVDELHATAVPSKRGCSQ